MIFIHFIAVPSPKMLNLQVTVLWLCCELQEQGWCCGEINCSQSPIFPRIVEIERFALPAAILHQCQNYSWGRGHHSPPMWLGFESWHQCHVGWVCCWVSLSLSLRGFSLGTPVFHSPQKPTFLNSNLSPGMVDEEPLCGCATFKSLYFILNYIYIYR